MIIDGGSVKGGVSGELKDTNGDPVYKLEISNPNGMAVTIGGKTWEPRNHAALGDTTLYAYVSKAQADENGLIRVATTHSESLYVIRDGALRELTGFDKSKAVWVWSEDGTAATLVLPLRDGGEPMTLQADVSVTRETPATCTQAGSRTYTATATVNGETFTDGQTVPLDPLGHAWSAEVELTENRSQALVTFICGNDPSHNQEPVTVTAFSAVTKEPTCGEPGVLTYRVDASEKAAELGCDDGTGVFTATEAIDALPHDWDVEGDEIGLIPGVDGDNLTVTITCRNDHSHTKTVYIKAEKISTTPATCTAEGSETYRMSYEFEGVKHVLGRTETRTLPLAPHTWGAWQTASGDTSGTTLERVCAVCGAKEQSNHEHTYIFPDEVVWTVMNDQVVSASVTVGCAACGWSEKLNYSGEQIKSRPVTENSCATGGWTAWTVNVDLDGQTRSYTKTTVLPSKGHVWAADDSSTFWSEDHSTATFTFRCATCDESTWFRVPSVVLGTTEATCEQGGEIIYSASMEYSGATAAATETVKTPPLGHEWDAEGDVVPMRPGVSGDFTTLTVFCLHDHTHSKSVCAYLKLIKNTPTTCTQSGTAEYRMAYVVDGQPHVIGKTETYELPALGHRYTTSHVCAVCGETEPGVEDGVEYTWDLPEDDVGGGDDGRGGCRGGG